MTNPVNIIAGLTPAIGLTGQELLWGVQSGSDVRLTTGAIAALANASGGMNTYLIDVTDTLCAANSYYAVRTDVGAFNLNLPALDSVPAASRIIIADVGYDASVNNITVTANGSDQIALFNAQAGTATISINDTMMLFTAVTGAYWRAIPSGM